MSIDFRWRNSVTLGVYHDDVHIADMGCKRCFAYGKSIYEKTKEGKG